MWHSLYRRMQKELTASIVTYKTDLHELEAILQILEKANLIRVYVVDNGMDDNVLSVCERFKSVKYIPSENVGYGAAHNVAMLKSMIETKAKYHLVLNSDIQFNQEVLSKMIEYMDMNEDVALLSPRIVFPNGELQYSARLLPTPLDMVVRLFFPNSLAKKTDKKYLLQDFDHSFALNAAYLTGCFMFMRLQQVASVGFFDEKMFLYSEDIDLTRRLHKHYRTMYWPEVTIEHIMKRESRKNLKIGLIHVHNMIKYFNKWGWLFDSDRRHWNKEVLDFVKQHSKN